MSCVAGIFKIFGCKSPEEDEDGKGISNPILDGVLSDAKEHLDHISEAGIMKNIVEECRIRFIERHFHGNFDIKLTLGPVSTGVTCQVEAAADEADTHVWDDKPDHESRKLTRKNSAELDIRIKDIVFKMHTLQELMDQVLFDIISKAEAEWEGASYSEAVRVSAGAQFNLKILTIDISFTVTVQSALDYLRLQRKNQQ